MRRLDDLGPIGRWVKLAQGWVRCVLIRTTKYIKTTLCGSEAYVAISIKYCNIPWVKSGSVDIFDCGHEDSLDFVRMLIGPVRL